MLDLTVNLMTDVFQEISSQSRVVARLIQTRDCPNSLSVSLRADSVDIFCTMDTRNNFSLLLCKLTDHRL